MGLNTLLIGPTGHGGEGVYIDAIRHYPPENVTYDVSAGFHTSSADAACILPVEVAMNRLVMRRTVPDMGIRAMRLRKRYDVVHVHAHTAWLAGLSDIPLVMSEGSSVAVYLGDYLGWSEEQIALAFARSRRLYRRLGLHHRLLNMDRTGRVYLFSEWARDMNVRWGADPAKLDVIYPGFETPELVQRDQGGTFTFLFVGRDFERKGGYDVIEAFSRISGDLPQVRLVVAGSDPSFRNPDLLINSWVPEERRHDLDGELADLIRTGRATRLPHVSQAQLRTELFPQADAFVMPTNAEGFGFTNVEAMSFALPVVTSTVGPATELVKHGETGILVPPGNVSALAEAMHTLATAPAKAAEMGTAGRICFEQRFTRERFRRELGALYRSVANQG